MSWRPKTWPVILEHGPVRLRPLRVRDEAAWHDVRARNAGWTGPWDPTAPPGSGAAARSYQAMVRNLAREARAGRMLPWAIWYRDADERAALAGQMTISGIIGGSARWGMAGYWVDGHWAGRGIAPTALALAGDHMFGPMGLHRLEVAIRPENTKSLRVVEKLGFRYEGERPDYLHVDGAWRAHAMFALHADEVGPAGLIGRLAG